MSSLRLLWLLATLAIAACTRFGFDPTRGSSAQSDGASLPDLPGAIDSRHSIDGAAAADLVMVADGPPNADLALPRDLLVPLDASADAAIPPPGCVAALDAPLQPLGGVSQCVALEGALVAVGAADTATDGVVLYTHDGATLTQQATFPTYTGPGALNSWGNDVLGVKLQGGAAYLATYYGGVVVLDVSVPTAPAFVAGLALAGETWAVEANGSHLFAANTTAGVVTLALESGNLVQRAALPLDGSPHDVHLVGSTLYVAAYTHVHQLAVDTSGNLSVQRSVAGFTQAYELWSGDGRYVYVADKLANALVVLDMNAPAGSERITSLSTTTQARSIAGFGNHLAVGTDDQLLSFDITSAAAPALLGAHSTSGSVYEIALANGLAVWGLRDGSVNLGDVAACP